MKKNTYTKKDIVNKISFENGISKEESHIILSTALDGIMKILLKTENNFRIELRGFGVFDIKLTKARDNARNPRTNEKFSIPARRKITFKAGNILRENLNKEIK
tara:strand:+ start:316 stop:627 length:312 start_codon:yes stop_codon:yes gene_type:complete